MADEFPTLEVALAALSPWLALRGVALGKSALRAKADLGRLSSALEHADAHAGGRIRSLESSWLAPLWRVSAFTGASEANHELRHQLTERSDRLRQRLRSAAARDLVVCAVLTGALAYAQVSSLGVQAWFYGFGIANAGLLLLAVGFRLHMAAELARATPGLAAAVSTRRSGGGDLAAARCRFCGEPNLTRITAAEELGARLTELGVDVVTLCRKCGHVGGRAHAAP